MTEQMVTKETRTDELHLEVNWSEHAPKIEEIGPAAQKRLDQVLSERKTLPRLPMQLIGKYADIAVRHARLQQIGRGEWFADILGFQGAWASESSPKLTLEELREVVKDWTLLKIEHRDGDLPVIEEINLNGL